MATFLALCQGVRLLSGAQGVGPLTVIDQSGYEQALVQFVVDSYVDIQNSREDFRFLRSSTTFLTVIDQQEYTPALDIKSYISESLVVTRPTGENVKIREINYEVAEERYLNNDTSSFPEYYAITPSEEVKLYPKPDAIYSSFIEYQENPEILTTDSQIPKLPLSLHPLIKYKALQKFSVFLGIPEVYREYSQEAARLSQKLMSLQVPQKRIKAPRFFV